jgi:hypothetical protein
VTIIRGSLTDAQKHVLARIDEEEIVRLASDLVRIPSFTTEETPCAEWLGNYLRDQGLAAEHTNLDELFLVTRVLALTALEAAA